MLGKVSGPSLLHMEDERTQSCTVFLLEITTANSSWGNNHLGPRGWSSMTELKETFLNDN